MIKRFVGCVLAAVTLSTAVMPAFAESADSPVAYYAQTTGYKFEKISHPNKPTQQPDGIVDYLGDGEVDVITDEADTNYNAGDRGQSYSWSAVAYGDWMYVGTCYAAMGNTMTLMQSVLGDTFDKETMELTLKTMFNGTFFWGQDDGVDSKGILVKVNTKTGETKLLMSNSLNNISPLFRNAIEYNGKLYFCGSVSVNGKSGLPSVYELDPKTDEYKVVYQGLSSTQDYGAAYRLGISTGIRGMCVYNDKLIISNVTMNSATGKSSATILASSDPSKGFTQIADSDTLFGYPAYRYQDSIYGGSIWDMVEYNGHLYVSICTGTPENQPDDNTMQSFALVRGDENPNGTFAWTPLVGDQEADGARYTFGIDPDRTRSGAANLIVYNGYLYIGEYNDEEIALERILFNKTGNNTSGSMGGVDCSFVNANLEQSVGIYRMDKNEDMQLVVGDASEMFPNGGISGLGSGFGHNENQYIWRMQVYDGKLYVGTFDTSSLLEPIGRFSNGNIINMTPEEWYTQLQYLKQLLEHLLKNSGSDETVLEEPGSGEDILSDEEAAGEEQLESLYDLADELEDASIMLDDVQTLDADDSFDVDERIAYYQAFADQYSQMLEAYQDLQENYDLSDDLQEVLDRLLNQDSLRRVQSVITCMKYLQKAERGFDLYVTSDGVKFSPLTTNGFNDPYNHGLRVFAVTDQGLCLGTANPFYGTQLWKLVSTSFGPTPSPKPSESPVPSEPTPTPSVKPSAAPAPSDPTPVPEPSNTPSSGSHSSSHSHSGSSDTAVISEEAAPTPAPAAVNDPTAANFAAAASRSGSGKKAASPTASPSPSAAPQETAAPSASPASTTEPIPSEPPAAADSAEESSSGSHSRAPLIAVGVMLAAAAAFAVVWLKFVKKPDDKK